MTDAPKRDRPVSLTDAQPHGVAFVATSHPVSSENPPDRVGDLDGGSRYGALATHRRVSELALATPGRPESCARQSSGSTMRRLALIVQPRRPSRAPRSTPPSGRAS